MVHRLHTETGLDRVVLSGGCFQNRILLEYCLSALTLAGFKVYHHTLVPTNDGGVALGQAVCAGAKQWAAALETIDKERKNEV
jgi:hydrogenase maturation protein HypF